MDKTAIVIIDTQAPINNCEDVKYPNCQNNYHIYNGKIQECANCVPNVGESCVSAPGC